MPTSDATGRADPLTSSREWRAASEWSSQVPRGPDPVKMRRPGCTTRAESIGRATLATDAGDYKAAGGPQLSPLVSPGLGQWGRYVRICQFENSKMTDGNCNIH
jgi:hypothetical protein